MLLGTFILELEKRPPGDLSADEAALAPIPFMQSCEVETRDLREIAADVLVARDI